MNSLLSLLFLTSMYSPSPVSAADWTDEDRIEEQEILQIKNQSAVISEVPARSPEEKTKKRAMLKSIQLALNGYRTWKRANPDFRRIRREFRSIKTKIGTAGTPENEALRRALSECSIDRRGCAARVLSNINSIYSASSLSDFVSAKASLSLIPKAHASGMSASSCMLGQEHGENYSHTDMSLQLFLGIFGFSDSCGLAFFGPGLGIMGEALHLQVCVGDGQGVNVGPYASVAGIFGLAAGLTIGQGGVCQMMSFQLGFGGFAGLIIVEDFGS